MGAVIISLANANVILDGLVKIVSSLVKKVGGVQAVTEDAQMMETVIDSPAINPINHWIVAPMA